MFWLSLLVFDFTHLLNISIYINLELEYYFNLKKKIILTSNFSFRQLEINLWLVMIVYCAICTQSKNCCSWDESSINNHIQPRNRNRALPFSLPFHISIAHSTPSLFYIHFGFDLLPACAGTGGIWHRFKWVVMSYQLKWGGHDSLCLSVQEHLH